MKFAQKYLMCQMPDTAELAFFCLPPIRHEQLAAAVKAVLPDARPVAAGYFHFTSDGKVRTYGRSYSLDLSSRATDAEFIEALAGATQITNPPPAP